MPVTKSQRKMPRRNSLRKEPQQSKSFYTSKELKSTIPNKNQGESKTNPFLETRDKNCSENKEVLGSLGLNNAAPKPKMPPSTPEPRRKARRTIIESDSSDSEQGENFHASDLVLKNVKPRENNHRDAKLSAAAGNYAEMFHFPASDDETKSPTQKKSPKSAKPTKFTPQNKSGKLILSSTNFFSPVNSRSHASTALLQSKKTPLKSATTPNKTALTKTTPEMKPSSGRDTALKMRRVIITEEMLNGVCETLTEKENCSGRRATACHQCKKVTNDQKTICRSYECRGYRGAVCGVCLEFWYGRSAKEALQNENWLCPACMGECQCNTCRKSRGLVKLSANITSKALMMGFETTVKYLKSCGLYDKLADVDSD